jgi:outer membrane autotransporter protein
VHTRSNKIAIAAIRLGPTFRNRLCASAPMRGYAGADDFRSGNNNGLFAARYSSRGRTFAFAALGLVASISPKCLGKLKRSWAARSKHAVTVAIALSAALATPASVVAQNLASFGILAGSTITNTGPSVINGNVGLSPGTSITGFPPGIVVPPSAIFNSDATAVLAQVQLITLFNTLSALPVTHNLSGQNLGGLTLTPGVYGFTSSAQLTGGLTLNGQGNPNSIFVINIGSTLTTASGSSISLINGAQASDVFFRVGSSATLGSTTAFQGDIVALSSITLDAGASINCGAALAHNGAVTLINNSISICTAAPSPTPPTPPPPTPPIPILPVPMTPAQLAAALLQLSGVAATGVAPSGMLAMSSFLSLVTNPFADRGVPPQTTPPPLIYKMLAFNGAAPEPSRWGIWATAYGGQQNISGDPSAGAPAWSATTFGAVMGLDYRATPYTTVGVALGGGSLNFGLSGGLGGGNGQMFQAAVYSLTRVNAAYLSAALSYGWYDMSTDRNVTLAGGGNLTSAFAANDVGGRIEGGYRFAIPGVFNLPGFGVTPYGALQGQYFIAPSYQETAATGASTFALAYNRQMASMIQTELGAWFDQTFVLDNGARLGLWTRAAWAHDGWAGTDMTAGFESLPGSAFPVMGALPGPDSLLASVGAGVSFKNGISLAGEFDSQLSQGWQTYGGFARLRYSW